MRVSIITPCLNARGDLPLAAASLTDQKGVVVEHIVADGGSSDGTLEWLESYPGIRWFSGSDRGMYDALNKGLAMAGGDILGCLNCDEQYLPGALSKVISFFDDHPDVDIVYGNMLVIGRDGRLLAFRKSYPLRLPYVLASHLYVPSCAIFWRRKIWDAGFRFDPKWQAQGDADFVLNVLQAGFRAARIPAYLATFTLGDANLGGTMAAYREMLVSRNAAPWWVKRFRGIWTLARLGEKLLSGAYFQKFPLEYELFVGEGGGARARFVALSGTSRWPVTAGS
jgi:glycosyltransferase involved in cell wall biosynthesis